METLKNFLVGLAVLILAPFVIFFGFIGWQLILGASSILIAFFMLLLLFVALFYFIVFIGFLFRSFLPKKTPK
ncbi:MAG: hypothetical protein HQL28_00150 [Candidatus Omnitrophica bacterium]|nr:hypothetical protein [Candidatus Omnitrophota bacterium]